MRSACSRNRLLLEGSMNSTPVKGVFGSAFWIQRFKTLILPSQNKHERSPKMSFTIVVADSGGSMNAKSHITTFKWRHDRTPFRFTWARTIIEQCAVHAHETSSSRGKHEQYSREGLFGSAFCVYDWFCLRKISERLSSALLILTDDVNTCTLDAGMW